MVHKYISIKKSIYKNFNDSKIDNLAKGKKSKIDVQILTIWDAW